MGRGERLNIAGSVGAAPDLLALELVEKALGTGVVMAVEWMLPPKPGRDKDPCRTLLGQALMVREFDRKVVKIQDRMAVLNL